MALENKGDHMENWDLEFMNQEQKKKHKNRGGQMQYLGGVSYMRLKICVLLFENMCGNICGWKSM